MGGIQIGNDSSSGLGTLGCLAQLNTDGTIVLLSNHHVMMHGGAANGELIGQPEISCCCCCKGNIVGEVVNSAVNGWWIAPSHASRVGRASSTRSTRSASSSARCR